MLYQIRIIKFIQNIREKYRLNISRTNYRNWRVLLTLISFLCGFYSISNAQRESLKRYSFTSPHMGTNFKIILYAAKLASETAFEKVETLNQILSDYEEDSELNKLSRLS